MLPVTLTHIEFQDSIHPVDPLMVPNKSHSSDPVIALPKANGWVLVDKFLQQIYDRAIMVWLGLIPSRTLGDLCCFKRLPPTDHIFSYAAFVVRR